MGFELPGIVIALVIICGIVLLFVAGAALFSLLIKLGVIVRYAQRPPHMDHGDYRLDQGREVRGEDDRR